MKRVDPKRRQVLASVGSAGLAGLTAGALLASCGAGPSGSPDILRAFTGPRTWLNTEPLGADALAGKVVLVNFWTYSCINSLRPLPYLRTWAQKYADRGLVVVGVHTPEFMFEHDAGKVRRAIEAQQVAYPVVLDNAYEIWNAFENNAWPGFYFVGADGRLRERVLGEGDYDRSERMIQRLLSDTGAAANDPIVDVPGEGVQAAPNWNALRSLETYVGYTKAFNFASSGGLREDTPAHYDAPRLLRLNQWGLSGGWNAGEEYATTTGAGAGISFRFHARDLHCVLGRAAQSTPIPFRVTIEGEPPGDNRGVDVDAAGNGVLDEDRMYQLVRQARPVEDRSMEITFSAPGARAYVFTFG
jgi:thiol-disulfide isomerase/thioredoxin